MTAGQFISNIDYYRSPRGITFCYRAKSNQKRDDALLYALRTAMPMPSLLPSNIYALARL